MALVDGLAIRATLDPDGMPPDRMLALLDARLAAVSCTRSKIAVMPWPPPMHMVSRP